MNPLHDPAHPPRRRKTTSGKINEATASIVSALLLVALVAAAIGLVAHAFRFAISGLLGVTG